MKKILSLALLVLLAGASLYASDAASFWARKILVGFDDNFYYCLYYESVQQGTDTEYTERVFWCKYKNDGFEVERKLLREIEHTYIEADETWVQRDTVELPMNPISYIIENNVKIAFPMNISEGSVFLDDEGIHYETEYESTLLVRRGHIEEFTKEYKSWPDFTKYSKDDFKVIGLYSSPTTLYVVLQFGGPDVHYSLSCFQTGKCQQNLPEKLVYQAIIPVPLKDMPKARKLTTHKVRTGENISRIAKKYGVTKEEIVDWNNLKNPDHIFIGQKLKIYKVEE